VLKQTIIQCDSDMLNLTQERIRSAVKAGHRILWDYKGMRSLVPLAIIEAELRLFDDYKSRLRVGDLMPERVGKVIWAQTIPVPEVELRDPDQTDIKS